MKNNENKTQILVDELVAAEQDKILSIEILGSREGENDMFISDIDLLVICRSKADISQVFNTAWQKQEKIFGIKSTRINRFIQKFFLGSNSYYGIHLIVLGRDEMDNDFQPISFRLKLMAKLIGTNLFLFEIKRNHHLLYGKNFFDEIRIKQPNFLEKLASFLFPAIVLLLAFPSVIFSRRTFKIWCFKAIKYHNISLEACAQIIGHKFVRDNALLNTAKFFRYKPDEYYGNVLLLYFRIWAEILGNLSFLLSKN